MAVVLGVVDLISVSVMNRKVSRIIFHCSANAQPHTVEDVRELHTSPKDARVFWNGEYVSGKGWSDIGYHQFIEFDGKISAGRADNLVGFHTLGWNTGSLGICHAGFAPNEAQVNSYKQVLFRYHRELGLKATLQQHCFYNRYKTCPCIPWDTWLELNRYWHVDLG